MNLSQIQDIQYLFNSIYKDLNQKLVIKFNNELITANFINLDEWDCPIVLDNQDESRNLKYNQRFNNLRPRFFKLLSNYQKRPDYFSKNQTLILFKIIEFIKSQSYDFHESIIYDVNFLDTDKKYDFLLVSEKDTFEVVTFID